MTSEWSFARNCTGIRALVIASFLLVVLGQAAYAQTAGVTINGTSNRPIWRGHTGRDCHGDQHRTGHSSNCEE